MIPSPPAIVQQVEATRFLAAISAVETGDKDAAIGKAGERGRYQLSAAVWRMHMPDHSFKQAHVPALAAVCARKHLLWLEDSLREVHCPMPEVQALALCWKKGLRGFLHGKFDATDLDYARRVENLYHDRP